MRPIRAPGSLERIAVIAVVLLFASVARAEDYDLSIDECAEPGAGCQPEMTDAELEAAEEVGIDEDPIEWNADAAAVQCPDGATNVDGACMGDAGVMAGSGGCSVGGGAGLIVVLALIFRRRLLPLALLACTVDASSWDDAIDRDAIGGTHDVFVAGSQYLLAHQPLHADEEPVAQFSLAENGDVPIVLGGQLLGYARSEPGDGTAELVEVQADDGTVTYETNPSEGKVTRHLGYVWPPGVADETPVDSLEATCTLKKRPATILLYASPGKDETLRFLNGCPGEVIVGEKREDGPVGAMKSDEAHARGGRTAFVVDRNGEKLRNLLGRSNGVERTAAYMRKKLQSGYDYIVIDEITAHPEFADGAGTNRRLRKLLQRMPRNTILPYISIDLTQYANGFSGMRARRLLLRAFKRRGRALALEVYLHTPQVMAGASGFNYRRAADRLALAVKGLAHSAGINRKAISVIGTSIHGGSSNLAQYEYLDQPSHDLESIQRQVNAIRHGSRRLRSQKGVGFYFVFKSDMNPRAGAPYSYDGLIRRMRLQALRFK